MRPQRGELALGSSDRSCVCQGSQAGANEHLRILLQIHMHFESGTK